MADFKPQPRVKNALDNNKFHLVAPNSKGKNASFQVSLVQTQTGQNEGALNPRVTVFTNDPDDTTDYGKIAAALDTPTFFAYLELIKRAIASTSKVRWKIDNRNFFVGGKRTETPTVVSSLLVGRDDDGSIWTTVQAPRRPNIKFVFGPLEFHSITEGDGNMMEKGPLSQVYAAGFVERLQGMLANLLTSMYVAPKPRDQNDGGGRGNYGGNRGGNGNAAANGGGNGGGGSSSAGDDDIPW